MPRNTIRPSTRFPTHVARLACLLVVGASLTSCAVLGRQQKDQPILAEKAAQVEKGMSKEQVVEILGAPNDFSYIRKENDPVREHAYIYEHIATKYTGIALAFINFGNSDEKRDRVVVFLDEAGKVSAVGKSLHANEASYGFPFGK